MMRVSILAATLALALAPLAAKEPQEGWTALDLSMHRPSWVVVEAKSKPAPTRLGTNGMSKAEKTSAQLDVLYEKGRQLYESGRLAEARKTFEEMLILDPNDYRARTYLDNTREEWERYLADQRAAGAEREKEEKGVKQLKTPITIETKQGTPLHEFLSSLSFASGIDFHPSSGIEAGVEAKFVDTPLADVLDAVLHPIGLKWTLSRGVVTIEPALATRVFSLTAEDMSKVKSLYDANVVQTMLWGAEGKPQLTGERLYLDERTGRLVATDSEARLAKLSGFLKDLSVSITPDLVTRYYKINPRDGEKIKALIDAVIRSESKTPFDLERRVYVDGEDLIIRESPERVAHIEEMLRNDQFIEKLVADKLQIATFSLIPRTAVEEQPEVMQGFANQVQEQVMTFLYAKSGIQQAAAEGRKMWYDPNTMTLVLTDTPDNIQQVKDFLGSLPELKTQEQYKIIFLRNSLADGIAGELNSLLGLAGVTGEGENELSVTKSLRVADEFTWRDLTVLVRRVNAGSNSNANGGTTSSRYAIDDDAELALRVEGSRQSTTQTVREKDVPVYISDAQGGEYEVYADDIRPTGNTGQGRVKLKITYNASGMYGM